MARKARSGAPRVTIIQFVGALVGFVLLSTLGGVLVAGLLLPVATVAGNTTKTGVALFDELDPELEQLDRLPQQSNIYANDGTTLIATFYTQNRVVVPLEKISPWIQTAVVDIEDRRFWDHNGVDGQGLIRALYTNATSGDSQGASTLTQQLIKNTLLANAEAKDDYEAIKAATEVSIARKLREAKLALTLEGRMNEKYGKDCSSPDPAVSCGKEKILEGYLNIAQFGRSVYGVEAASQFYFGKPAAEVNALEAATMAGITQNPYKWDPSRDMGSTKIRRDTVLGVMRDVGDISKSEYDQYVATPLASYLTLVAPKYSCVAAEDADIFCDYVTKVITGLTFDVKNSKGETEQIGGSELLYTGGLNIITTLNIDDQRVANKILRKKLKPVNKYGFANALVSVDPRNGHILTMAQGRKFAPGSTEKGTTAINYSTDRSFGGSRGFSPGSLFKPIVLATWLDQGHYLSEAVSGAIRAWPPDTWKASCLPPGYFNGSGIWKPGNTGNTGANQQTALSATAHSINTSFAAMTSRLDLCAIRDMAVQLGFKRADNADIEVVPSMSLGTQNASPLTMAGVASVFANDGVRCEPVALISITGRDGHEYAVPPELCRQVLDVKIAHAVEYAMTQVMEVGTGKYVQLKGRRSAGKSGTAQNNTHTWFLGFVPQRVTVTWLGHPDKNRPQQNVKIGGKTYSYVYGATISGPTWNEYMTKVLKGQKVLPLPTSPPPGVGSIQIVAPNVLGRSATKAKNMINDAGLKYAVDSVRIYTLDVPYGKVAYQSVPEGTSMGPGQTLKIALARDKLPSWFTTWPPGKNPCKKPSDWWGGSWPPAEFTTNPPIGWDYSPCLAPPPSPSPGP